MTHAAHTKHHAYKCSCSFVIAENISLADKNWFSTGGQARYFAQPCDDAEFVQALEFAYLRQLPIFMLGHGANILVSDEGFDGLVIQPNLQTMSAQQYDDNLTIVTAGAGVAMADLISWCLDRNIIGLEEFSGIPGTVGGSVYINVHYFEFLLSQFLICARVIRKSTGSIAVVKPDWFNFGYNQSTLQQGEYFLLDATFALKPATDLETAFARGRTQEIIRHRKQRYPYKNTCGSFFRNFYEHEVSLEQHGKKIIFVAYYFDKLGIKGQLRVGNAQVSHQHANMIVTSPGATSKDIIQVARSMQQKVYEQFGITPQPECRLVGFSSYPLL